MTRDQALAYLESVASECGCAAEVGSGGPTLISTLGDLPTCDICDGARQAVLTLIPWNDDELVGFSRGWIFGLVCFSPPGLLRRKALEAGLTAFEAGLRAVPPSSVLA